MEPSPINDRILRDMVLWLFIIIGAMIAPVQSQNRPPIWVNTLEQELRITGIAENKPPGYSICCFKAVDPEGLPVTYSIASNDLFQVDPKSGAITLQKPLDREKNAIVTLLVSASDGVQTSDIGVIVTVVDVNDNSPTITGNTFIRVYENATVGSVVFTGLNISDLDVGNNALINITCDPVDALSAEACTVFGVTSRQYIVPGTSTIFYVISVTLKQPLDYETKREYIMTLRAQDLGVPPRNTSVNLLFEVLNVEDSPPIWVSNPINDNVDDGKPAGTFVTLVGARDLDADPRPIIITITSDPDDTFNLTAPFDAGLYTYVEIQLKRPVDRENKTDYVLNLRATELYPNGSMTNTYTDAVARIYVRDINDNPPTFSEQTLTLSVQEELPAQSELPIMNVRDADTSANGKFLLTLVQPYPTFEINPTSGVNVANLRLSVLNSSLLDYEVPAYRVQIINVIATETELADTNHGPFTSTATVTVSVYDINDNYPIFEKPEYSVRISEALPVGSSVLTVKATDLDSGINGQITYSLEGAQSQQTGNNRFSIDPNTGLITLAEALNYEEVRSISLFILAKDGGNLQTSAKLYVEVLNVNDQAPVFSLSEYQTFVEEGSTLMFPAITVLATDTEGTSVIRYSIVAGNTADSAFTINATSGNVVMNRPVKYEEAYKGDFLLNISASDSASPPQFGYAAIRIHVIDINDNPPVFTSFDYHANVSEIAAPGTSITQVFATDKDTGLNGQIIYRITNGSLDRFTIDTTMGIIRVSSNQGLDYDLQKKYSITVTAEDKGSPPMTGTAYVTIDILDANNKLPYFTDQLILARIPTSARAGYQIVDLNAVDADTNALLEYRIIPESFVATAPDGSQLRTVLQSQMTINSSTGVIYLIQSLDTNGASEFKFTVEVQDLNAVDPPIQRAQADVVCTIYKETGTMPEFNSPWTISNPVITLSMQEEEPPGTVVTTLIATDPVTGQQLNDFTEVPGSDPNEYFSVISDTAVNSPQGQVILKKRVDYDTIFPPQISVDVEVRSVDQLRSARAKIILNIQDINDNNPIFYKSEYQFSIAENKVFPSQVGAVLARDADASAKYNTITYSISGRGAEKFFIDPNTGYIQVARMATLDREQVAQYDLLVTASNEVPDDIYNKKSTSVRLTIVILDVNDVTPHFEQQNYTIFAVQTASAQSSLGRVRATDEDAGANGQIYYTIASGDEYNLFIINGINGEIRSRTQLLNFARSQPYVLRVQATDGGYPPLVGTVPVYIFIQDLQAYDGRPKFVNPLPGQVVMIPEEQPPNYFVVQVVAIDNDGPIMAIRFSFLSGDAHDDHAFYNIDPISGNITTAQRLDRETQELYNLLVLATDGSTPQQENTMVVVVKLIDINDNVPTFYRCNTQVTDPMYATVMENQPANTFVTRIMACDADINENAIIYYQITCGNEGGYFTVGLHTGEIDTLKPIDRETTPSFSICLRVSNQENVSQVIDSRLVKRDVQDLQNTSLIHVDISVGDQDDNGPSYSRFPISQPENMSTTTIAIPVIGPFGSVVLDASVMDPDTISNSIVKYDITRLVFHTTSSANNAPNMFTLGGDTGLIRTGLASYSDYALGFFEMRIKAQDNLNRISELTVYIYILSQSERLKFVFTRQPDSVRAIAPDFSSKLENQTRIKITLDNIRYKWNDDGSFDYTKTDLCFHGVLDKQLISYQLAMLQLNPRAPRNDVMANIYQTYGVQDIGLCTLGMKTYTRWTVASFWWVMIAAGLLLIIFVIILIIVICYMWRRYKKYMGAQISYVAHTHYESRMLTPEEPKTLYVLLGAEKPIEQPIRSSSLRNGHENNQGQRASALYAEVDHQAPK